MRIFHVAFLLLTLVACGGSPVRPDQVPPAPSTNLVDTYRIGVDDVLQISVWRNPDLDVSVPVRPDGKISVPLVGDVVAGGKTPETVADDIKARLSEYIRDPIVAVILTSLQSHEYLSRIRVTGAVNNPITIPYRQGITILDAVLAAGGPTEFAIPNRSTLYRSQDGESNAYSIALGDILTKGLLGTNYQMQPGDVLTIPERTF